VLGGEWWRRGGELDGERKGRQGSASGLIVGRKRERNKMESWEGREVELEGYTCRLMRRGRGTGMGGK